MNEANCANCSIVLCVVFSQNDGLSPYRVADEV